MFQILAVVRSGDDVVLRLHDHMHWVTGRVSKSLAGYINAGVFMVGDIVELVTTLGPPENLHIVSYIYSLSTYPSLILDYSFSPLCIPPSTLLHLNVPLIFQFFFLCR